MFYNTKLIFAKICKILKQLNTRVKKFHENSNFSLFMFINKVIGSLFPNLGSHFTKASMSAIAITNNGYHDDDDDDDDRNNNNNYYYII